MELGLGDMLVLQLVLVLVPVRVLVLVLPMLEMMLAEEHEQRLPVHSRMVMLQ
jgi:hypothetical protein